MTKKNYLEIQKLSRDKLLSPNKKISRHKNVISGRLSIRRFWGKRGKMEAKKGES